jgi:integrase
MDTEERRKPIVWTGDRKARFWAAYRKRLLETPEGRGDRGLTTWRRMDLRPGPVMVWEPADLGAFLDYATGRSRWITAYELIAATGMRRAEVCGLPWDEIDLDGAELGVSKTRVQVGWEVAEVSPKSEAGRRTNSLDAYIVKVLRAWRRQQLEERLAWGTDYIESGLVFTRENGEPIHPDTLTESFERLAFAAGLPPIKLHGLRHGWASYALKAGVDISVVQRRLGHSTSQLTRDTYTGVLSDLDRAAADSVAAIIPRRSKRG